MAAQEYLTTFLTHLRFGMMSSFERGEAVRMGAPDHLVYNELSKSQIFTGEDLKEFKFTQRGWFSLMSTVRQQHPLCTKTVVVTHCVIHYNPRGTI